MNIYKFMSLVIVLVGFLFFALRPTELFSQEKGKGDLEDFADDFGEEESGSDSDSEDTAEFFLWVFLENIDFFVQFWGGTPSTEFGPFPSHPYAAGNGFMANSNNFRSYFFNTEFSYHYLNDDLRSYILKWETQFIHSSKLAFDLAVYEEDLFDEYGLYKDRMTFWGVHYGHALFRTPQLILNIEGGFRGFYRNRAHGGPEIAVDMQLFPQKPVVIETKLAAAYVSNGPLYTVESSAGILLGRYEVLAGMRILKNKSADLLDGFKVGFRVWY